MKKNRSKLAGEFLFFASYSRKDKEIVAPLVELLRVSGSAIFRDEDSIPPGVKWRPKISAALEKCETVIVFWCRHAEASEEVKLEYQRAIELGKAVVPVLLDSTVMPEALAEYQAIDLQAALGIHEGYVIYGTFPELRTGCIGRIMWYLREPSDEELQSGTQHLAAQLYKLRVAGNL